MKADGGEMGVGSRRVAIYVHKLAHVGGKVRIYLLTGTRDRNLSNKQFHEPSVS